MSKSWIFKVSGSIGGRRLPPGAMELLQKQLREWTDLGKKPADTEPAETELVKVPEEDLEGMLDMVG